MSENTGADLVGQVVASQFSIERRLGAGGMGAVYLADQLGMDRRVVVKVMHPELTAGSPTAVERFKREAKAVAQLNHPNIVQIYVFGQADTGQMYIAMEFIEGRDLTDELDRGAMAQPRALRILDQVCSALIEAHAAGIVHRDLKPDNIMLTDRHGNPDYVKVLDFGIAKMAEPEGQAALTQAGMVFGTPRYMAPEQAQGGRVDARADIYSLGVILYEMLTGVHPFRTAETALEYIVKHATEDIIAPSEAFENLEIQPRVEALLARCTAKDPDARFQSARELQREVRLALRDFPEAARGFPTDGEAGPQPVARPTANKFREAPTIAVPPAESTRSGTPAWVWAVVVLLVVGGAGVGLAVGLSGGDGGSAPAVTVAGTVDAPPGGETAAPTTAPVVAGGVAAGGDALGATRPAEVPKTDVAEGMPLDGFPVPARSRLTTTTPQAEILETDLSGREVIDFYRAKLAGRYGALQEIPNGLMVGGDETPFSTISVMPSADQLTIILSRNAMAKRPSGTPVGGAGKEYFGVTLADDASVVMKSTEMIVTRSRQPIEALCKRYTDALGGIDGTINVQDLEATTPYCNFAATPDADTAWQTVSIIPDPSARGAVMVTIQGRQ